MNNSSEKVFKEFVTENRYKSLERTLKLAQLYQSNISCGCSSPTWPSVSSIHEHNTDDNILHTPRQSRIGNEVVSSSNNLKNFQNRQNQLKSNLNTMTTSTVKGYPLRQVMKDENMPPPNYIPNRRKANTIPTIDKSEFSVQKPNTVSTNKIYKTIQENGAVPKQDETEHEYRIFSLWRVQLNDIGQLTVRGIVEGGKLARSKPILKKISAIQVMSVCKHIYILQGNLVDDHNELPDYVRGKFINGFPDDWENVHDLWKSYVAQGCNPNFRWPTPIADSDDDLDSQISDITFYRGKLNSSEIVPKPNSPIRTDKIGFHQNLSLQKGRNIENSVNEVPQNNNRLNDFAEADSRIKNSNKNYRNFNIPLKMCPLENFIHQDKLNIIIHRLKDENCPQEYIDKIIDMIDCFNYIFSYEITEDKESQAELVVKKNIINQKNIENKEENDLSDNDIYMGVPKLSIDRVFRNKESLKNPYKNERKVKRNSYSSRDEGIASYNNKSVPSSYDKTTSHNCADSNSYSSYSEDENYHKIFCKKENVQDIHDILRDKCTNFQNSHIHTQKSDPSYKTRIQNGDQTKYVTNNKLIVPQSSQENYKYEGISKRLSPQKKPKIISSIETQLKVNISRNNSTKKSALNSSLNHSESDIDENMSKQEYIMKQQIDNTDKLKDNKINQRNIHNGKMKKRTEENMLRSNDDISYCQMMSDIDPENTRIVMKNSEVQQKLKSLHAWAPRVIPNPESKKGFGLIFEGDLLNDLGHIMNRKYSTAIVKQRLSPNRIETIDNNIYELVGSVNDKKHDIPKELLNLCRNGCPMNIDEFCKKWMLSCEPSMVNNSLQNSPKITSNISKSLRGRKIIPPLNYWNGERVTVRGESAMYEPGRKDKDSNVNFSEKDDENTRKNLRIKKSILSNETDGITKTKSITKRKAKIGSFSDVSDESSIENNTKRGKYRTVKKKVISKIKENTNELIMSPSQATRSKVKIPLLNETQTIQPYTYYRRIPIKDDILSEDQQSIVN